MSAPDTPARTMNVTLEVYSISQKNQLPGISGYCLLNKCFHSIHDELKRSNGEELPVNKDHCEVSPRDRSLMTLFPTKQKFFVVICCFLVFCSCKKDVVEKPVSDAIFGEYFYNPPSSGGFWSDLLDGTSIGVFPVNTTYIKITNTTFSYTGTGATVFDSVKLVSPTSFTINQLIRDQQSSSGFSFARGTGNFGKKLVSYNILIERNGLTGNTSIVVVNAVKTKD